MKIKLPNRYGNNNYLEQIAGNCWKLVLDKSNNYTRLIGFDGESKIGSKVKAIDPEGGPFISVGSKIDNYTVETIMSNGIIWLKENEVSV